MKVLLYKTVRELLFNMVKHAQAGHVMINIRKLTGTVEIDVIDDGVGFSRPYAPSYGLFSVAERIKYLGGTMETGTNTETGKGARVSITVPLTQKNKGGARV